MCTQEKSSNQVWEGMMQNQERLPDDPMYYLFGETHHSLEDTKEEGEEDEIIAPDDPERDWVRYDGEYWEVCMECEGEGVVYDIWHDWVECEYCDGEGWF